MVATNRKMEVMAFRSPRKRREMVAVQCILRLCPATDHPFPVPIRIYLKCLGATATRRPSRYAARRTDAHGRKGTELLLSDLTHSLISTPSGVSV